MAYDLLGRAGKFINSGFSHLGPHFWEMFKKNPNIPQISLAVRTVEPLTRHWKLRV